LFSRLFTLSVIIFLRNSVCSFTMFVSSEKRIYCWRNLLARSSVCSSDCLLKTSVCSTACLTVPTNLIRYIALVRLRDSNSSTYCLSCFPNSNTSLRASLFVLKMLSSTDASSLVRESISWESLLWIWNYDSSVRYFSSLKFLSTPSKWVRDSWSSLLNSFISECILFVSWLGS